jgi:hypothetical protein
LRRSCRRVYYPSVERVIGSALEWCGRELEEEVFVTAEVGEKAPDFTPPRGRLREHGLA